MYPGFKYQSQPNQPRPIVLYIELASAPVNAAVQTVTFTPEAGAALTFQHTNLQVLQYPGGTACLRLETYGPSLFVLTDPLIGRLEVTYTLDTLKAPLVTETDSLDCTLYPD